MVPVETAAAACELHPARRAREATDLDSIDVADVTGRPPPEQRESRTLDQPLPGWVPVTVMLAALGIMTAAELARPLRPRVENHLRRFLRNATTGGIALAVSGALQVALLTRFSAAVREADLGLLPALALPPWAAIGLGMLLLDYTLWGWHLLNHRVPFLWRFHLVHHVDLDLDASTALRFHFGELALSVGYRALQVAAIGPAPLAVACWQAFLFASIFFHHSNLRLPLPLERALVPLVVTPRMHGIHHSVVDAERDRANFANILTVWDYLHGTILLNVPQREVRIGVPGHLVPEVVTLPRILLLPFRRPGREPSGPPPASHGSGLPPRTLAA
jgi:sterol desaturase/sphingolipid hydroxylase (fatty acid hydroxylase superfamily)